MTKLKLEQLNRVKPEHMGKIKKSPIVLVLDNIRSLNNVGSIFRTADAFLVEKIYLCGITGTPPHRDITKTALGATDTVDWEYSNSTINLLEQLKNESFQIISIEQTTKSELLNKFQPHQNVKYALVLGNEVDGVSNEVIKMSDSCIEIPQFGSKHSLNVSVATGIVVWDFIGKLSV